MHSVPRNNARFEVSFANAPLVSHGNHVGFITTNAWHRIVQLVLNYRRTVAQLCALLALVLPLHVGAQEIRGTVRASDGSVAEGVVMVLLHATKNDSVIASAVTNQRGLYSLKTSVTGAVRLRALRIGFQPLNIGAPVLTKGVVESLDILLTSNRIQLATVAVTSAGGCAVRPEGSQLVAKLFVEARTALLATGAQLTGNISRTQYTDFTRYENFRGKLASPVERVTLTQSSVQPYGSVSADSLSRRGYVVTTKEGVTYYAPDAKVLLSDAFASEHCLQLVEGTGDHAGSIGIGFRPVNRPRNIVDVTGTLWLDRQSYELQYLEYGYDPLPTELRRADIGGRVEYTRMSDGMWFISRWSIRTPMTVAHTLTSEEARLEGKPTVTTVTGIKISGGEVQTVRVDNNVLYSNNSALQAGASRDDIMGNFPVTAGSFVPQAPREGRASLVCGEGHDDYIGSVQGKVFDARRQPLATARVTAEWQEEFRVINKNDFTWQTRTLATNSQSDGAYAVCELPVYRPIKLSAARNKVRSYTATVKLAREAATAQIDFGVNTLDDATTPEGDSDNGNASANRLRVSVASIVEPPHAATLSDAHNSQLEITDAVGMPIPYATVTVNGAARVSDVHGVVFLNNVHGDSMFVAVRRLSYAPFRGQIARASGTDPFRLTLLPTAQSLKTFNVIDRATINPLASAGFYERMQEVQNGASTGEFFTPEDLDERMPRSVTQFLNSSKYAKITQYVPPSGSKLSSRPPQMLVKGRLNCYMSILIDGVLIHQTGEAGGIQSSDDAVDERVNMADVAAIEIYPSLANAPMSIASKVRGAACGIVAIWTGSRR